MQSDYLSQLHPYVCFRKMEASSGGSKIPEIQTFQPSIEKFKDFPSFIKQMEASGAHKAGLAKVSTQFN